MSIPADENRERLSVVATMRAKPGMEQELRTARRSAGERCRRSPVSCDGQLVITPLHRLRRTCSDRRARRGAPAERISRRPRPAPRTRRAWRTCPAPRSAASAPAATSPRDGAASSASSTSRSSVRASMSSTIRSPSRTSAIGPPSTASGRDVPDAQPGGRPGEPAVGEQQHVLAQPGALDRAGDGQHLAHARAAARALVADHHDVAGLQRAVGHRGHRALLAVEHPGGALEPRRVEAGALDHRARPGRASRAGWSCPPVGWIGLSSARRISPSRSGRVDRRPGSPPSSPR